MNLPSQQVRLPTIEMVKKILEIGGPAILCYFFSLCVEAINLVFIGHLGNPHMVAGVGFANTYINMTSIAISIGLNQALGTLVSQSYGQGNMYACGVYLNKARIIAGLLQIPMVFLLYNSHLFMDFIEIDSEMSYQAQVYINYCIPGIIAFGQYDAVRSFLNNIEKSFVPLVVIVITTALHVVWCYILIFDYNLGVKGASIATCITYFLNLIFLTIIASHMKDIKEAWFWPNKQCFQNLWSYLKLGLPSAALLCLELWCYQTLTIFSGYLPIEQTAAQVMIMNISIICYTAPMGLSIAASALVGKSIGQQNIPQAKKYIQLIRLYGLLQTFIQSMLFLIGNEHLARIMTSNEQIQKEIVKIFSDVIWIEWLFASTMAISGGIIRGMGKQLYATIGAIIGFYFLAIPIGLLLAFKFNYQLLGFWIGILIAEIFMASFYQYLIYYMFDWNKLVQESIKRKEKDFNCQVQVPCNDPIKEKLITIENE